MNLLCIVCWCLWLPELSHFEATLCTVVGFGTGLFQDNTSFWFLQRVTPPHFIGANSLQKSLPFLCASLCWTASYPSTKSRYPAHLLKAWCAILVWHTSHLQEVCTCLVLENSMYVLTFTLGLCRLICFFLSPPVCFPQFCMALPSFLHSLPRLNGLERGVCQLSVPPFAGCMHMSCIGKPHVHFWLALLHFPWSFLGSWSPPVCFLQLLHGSAFIFAYSSHFCTVFPLFIYFHIYFHI